MAVNAVGSSSITTTTADGCIVPTADTVTARPAPGHSSLVLPDRTHRRDAQIVCHARQLDDRGRAHFLEHPVTMDLGGLQRDAEIEADLLIELAADQVREHFALAAAQEAVTPFELTTAGGGAAKPVAVRQRARHGIEQLGAVGGLG